MLLFSSFVEVECGSAAALAARELASPSPVRVADSLSAADYKVTSGYWRLSNEADDGTCPSLSGEV